MITPVPTLLRLLGAACIYPTDLMARRLPVLRFTMSPPPPCAPFRCIVDDEPEVQSARAALDRGADAPLVCLVDTDRSLLRSLRRLLEAHGFNVEAFLSAGAFLAGWNQSNGWRGGRAP
jgi:hypothetical protein